MTRRATVLVSWLVWVAAGAAGAEPMPPDRARAVLREALAAFDQATAVAQQEPATAVERYRQAAAGFEALRDAGYDNAVLEYNLGNTYFRLGELGRAILHYRRAERLGLPDAQRSANLRYARERVEPRIEPSGQARLSRSLLFWHYDTTPRQRYRALVVLALAGWPLLLAWLRWRRPALLGAGVVAAALAVACGLSLRWQLYDEAVRPPAVVIARDVPLRLGRGEGSDLALKQPLGPGVEVRILETRGDWVQVRLPNDQVGWLPAGAVEPV